MADRLLVDLDVDGLVTVGTWPDGGLPETVSQARLEWPLDEGMLEELRWYLEDYLRAPFGVWEDRGPQVQARLAGWGEAVFASVFGSGSARDAYQRARDRGLELVFRSDSPRLLGLPWELMRDPAGPAALGLAGMSRALPTADLAQMVAIPGGRLRVLMVISRPAGTRDIGYQMIARPLMERLDAVRGEVDLVVLRPPTLDALRATLADAAEAGEPFHVMHFDGHGALHGSYGLLVLEGRNGGPHPVSASRMAAVLKDTGVPVVVLNACQSGAVGKDLEAAVATRLVREGATAVVAMAYSVYAVAAAEFMAMFYERLFAGDTISAAVTAGRRRLFEKDGRPSPKGDLPLADWLVPVHYLRRNIAFPQARTSRPKGNPSLEALLDDLRTPVPGPANGSEGLEPVGVFVGRDDLFYELEAATRLQKVVVLHGPGGTGKTELAKAFGRWWRDTGGTDRPEWVLWHSFEPGVASFGLDGMITGTGLQIFGSDFARLEQVERQRKVEGLLKERRLLLIWDNFEAVHSMPDPARATAPLDDAECAVLKGFLSRLGAGGESAVVITSRTAEEWLGPVRRIEVSGLAREETAQYAGELLAPYPAAVVAPRRARRAFGDLLEWLDGHPLSMRLILPRLATTEPEALLDGLSGITPLPGGDEGGDRATSLAASITYSYDHLTPKTQRLLVAICLFQAVADSILLAGFSGSPDVPSCFRDATLEDWRYVLKSAAQVGLLTELGYGMYRMHPALPAFLAARWHQKESSNYDDEKSAALRTFLTVHVGRSHWLNQQISFGDAGLAFKVIDLERRTLGALLGYALDHHLWEEAQAIATPLSMYWDSRGLVHEASAWADRARTALENSGNSAPSLDTAVGELWLLFTVARAGRQMDEGRFDSAEQTFSEILTLLQAAPESPKRQKWLAATYDQLGTVARKRGRIEDAEAWYDKALDIKVRWSDHFGMADSYNRLGSIAQERGQLGEAREWYSKSLVTKEELGDRPGIAVAYHNLGWVAQERELLDEAADWHKKSLAIKQELSDRAGMANSYHHLGMVAQGRGWLDEAEYWYRKSLIIEEESRNRPRLANTYHHLGTVAQKRGHLDEAKDWSKRSLTIREALGDRAGMAASYHQLGNIAYLQDRGDDAEDWNDKSLAIYEELGDRPHMATTLAQRGLYIRGNGRPLEALEWVVRCVALFEEFPHPVTEPGARELARLTTDLGIGAVSACWQAVTGKLLPTIVRNYIIDQTHENGEVEFEESP